MPRPSKKKAPGRKTKTKAGLDVSATATNPPAPQRTTSKKVLFRLMDLPPELMLRVIRHAVVISSQEKPLRITNDDPEAIVPPAITRACRLFRTEGVPLFYSNNIFLGGSDHRGADSLWQWLEVLGAKNRQRLGGLYVEWLDGEGADQVRFKDRQLYLHGFLHEHPVTLENFLQELLFHGDRVGNSIKQVYYRTHCGKVVLDLAQPNSASRYQLSLRRGLAKSAEWTSAMPYFDILDQYDREELLEDLHRSKAANSTDFWVAEESIWVQIGV